ncbi:hypothetical protein WJX72_011568 [[Myrmecia] bisecta]|uniref:Uncharacterized protein n=1 Tax=[Myrmecia] bisecta TaxID=41462 RepID=A0AAW1Q2R4_9CHLO
MEWGALIDHNLLPAPNTLEPPALAAILARLDQRPALVSQVIADMALDMGRRMRRDRLRCIAPVVAHCILQSCLEKPDGVAGLRGALQMPHQVGGLSREEAAALQHRINLWLHAVVMPYLSIMTLVEEM